MKKIILKSKFITLRPFKLLDAPIFYRWFQDKEVIKFLMAPPPKNVQEEIKFVRKCQRRKNGCNFAVINEAGKLIGSVGIGFNKDDGTATLGILIGEKKEWGKGYATEALHLLIKLAFSDKRIHRVQLQTSTDNKRALLTYKKVGFKPEGVLRQATYNPVLKRFDDDVVMSILRREWQNF